LPKGSQIPTVEIAPARPRALAGTIFGGIGFLRRLFLVNKSLFFQTIEKPNCVVPN
jgi:hypothetical protein